MDVPGQRADQKCEILGRRPFLPPGWSSLGQGHRCRTEISTQTWQRPKQAPQIFRLRRVVPPGSTTLHHSTTAHEARTLLAESPVAKELMRLLQFDEMLECPPSLTLLEGGGSHRIDSLERRSRMSRVLRGILGTALAILLTACASAP